MWGSEILSMGMSKSSGTPSEGRSTAEASEESGSEGGSKEEVALEEENSDKWGILGGMTGEGMDRKERGNVVDSVHGNMWIL